MTHFVDVTAMISGDSVSVIVVFGQVELRYPPTALLPGCYWSILRSRQYHGRVLSDDGQVGQFDANPSYGMCSYGST